VKLLQETLEIMSQHNKTPADVRWVGSFDGMFVGTWPDFVSRANFEYNPGSGSNEVAMNLVVVGDDWWLERGEYDGSEWWDFKTVPTMQPGAQVLPETFQVLNFEEPFHI
jgi:hypothetical protein